MIHNLLSILRKKLKKIINKNLKIKSFFTFSRYLLVYNKRAIHEKFFTLHLHQIWQFARECELIGPTLTAYDVSECVKAMHAEHW